MAGSIKGIIVEIGGDTSNLQKALSKVNSETSSLSKELKGINTLLKFDPKNTELLAQKQQVVTEQIAKTEEKLQDLQTTYKQAVEAEANGSKISEENWRNIQREIVATENKLKQLKAESSNWTAVGNALETVGTKIQNIGDKTTKAGQTLSTTVTPVIAGLGALAIKTFDEVDTGVDNIIKKTGAVGEEAKALEDVYKSVSVEVVGSFEEIGNAVGEINTRFGFTDKILDEASKVI
jgi:phage-related minor tail protein